MEKYPTTKCDRCKEPTQLFPWIDLGESYVMCHECEVAYVQWTKEGTDQIFLDDFLALPV